MNVLNRSPRHWRSPDGTALIRGAVAAARLGMIVFKKTVSS
jgi:hypothetical protein